MAQLRCPHCVTRGDDRALVADDGTLRCGACQRRYPVRDGIPICVTEDCPLYAERDVVPSHGRGINTQSQREYWEADSVHRDARHPVVEGFSRQRWAHVARRVDLGAVRSALDVGAGNGFSSIYAPAQIDVVATDGSWRMLSRHPGHARVIADATALPFAGGSFDLVFCWELLHHVDEPWRALREMARVSRKSVVFFEPNPLNLAQFLFSLYDREHRRVLRFSRRYVADQVQRAGLRLLTFERCGLILPNRTPPAVFRLLQRAPFRCPMVGISQLVVAEKAA
jgi:SAM-dependent methyltransferase/uncharacterized protein YbaR (Trm112 family)